MNGTYLPRWVDPKNKASKHLTRCRLTRIPVQFELLSQSTTIPYHYPCFLIRLDAVTEIAAHMIMLHGPVWLSEEAGHVVIVLHFTIPVT